MLTRPTPRPLPGPCSLELFAEASKRMPGGVSSPVRSFRGVGGSPLFIEGGSGSRLIDADGNEFIDYVLSWGPLAAGHAHPAVVQAIAETAAKGTSFGAPSALETELAARLQAALPGLELIRFVNSGTEAVMSAIRLARAYTRRDKIVKFAGGYHGHSDALLVQAGSGALTLGNPSSPGVPGSVVGQTIVLPYNDQEALQAAFRQYGSEIACVLVEPVAGNMGFVRPHPGFLPLLRELSREHRAVLIFDEVMTGFRISPGGAQQHFQIEPDLTCLGKVIGGGLPVGAYGGREEIMSLVAPLGPVYQAGTLSGNPLAMAAGIATLDVLLAPGAFAAAQAMQEKLTAGLRDAAARAGIPLQTDGIGTMFGLFFADKPVTDLATAQGSDQALFQRFFWDMLDEGIYLAPSAFEAGFLSTAHTEADIDQTLAAAERVFRHIGHSA